jgi:hypothetical protein
MIYTEQLKERGFTTKEAIDKTYDIIEQSETELDFNGRCIVDIKWIKTSYVDNNTHHEIDIFEYTLDNGKNGQFSIDCFNCLDCLKI